MVADRSKIPLPASMLGRGNISGRQSGQTAALPKANVKSVTKKRRGFGLFSEDEGEGEETRAESSRLSVSFSGNKSGFEELGKAKGRRMSADGTGTCGLFMILPALFCFDSRIEELLFRHGCSWY